MELTLWTYEGPPHVGAMRIATAMRGVHYVLHAPQGDTYADLLFTMIERRDQRPPVTYTTFQARDLGADTSELFQRAVRDTYERHRPDALLVGASCTAELLQDDPGGLCQKLGLPIPIVPLELPSYQRKENWGASETFYHLVRAALNGQAKAERPARARWVRPRCNLLGATALGFRHRDDVTEITRLLDQLGVDVAVVAPWQATVADLRRLPEADFNVVMYPEIGKTTADWLQRTYDMPRTQTVPIGRGASAKFAAEVCELMGLDLPDLHTPKSRWYAQSVDSTYLTGKRVFVFGDATHAMAAARIARFEMGFDVVGLGTYSREFAREVRELATEMGLQALITDNHLEVEAAIEALQPELILGTQMERHIAKRHGMPCAVISAPVHVQDFPARYSPQMGEEGSNVMFDTWIHPLMMGLEEHLLGMFREDFEFHGQAAPSHLGQAASTQTEVAEPMAASGSRTEHVAQSPHSQASAAPAMAAASGVWSVEAERELGKIPFFVRNKARRNTERYAKDVGVQTITVETLYEAKAHFSR